MEAILKSGKKIHGKIAQILVKKGRATPIELEPAVVETEPVLEEVIEPIAEPVLGEEKPVKKEKKPRVTKAPKVQKEKKLKAKK